MAAKGKKPNISVVEKEKEPVYIDVAYELAEFKRIEKEKLSTCQRNLDRIDMFKALRDDAKDFLHTELEFDETMEFLRFGQEIYGRAIECLDKIDEEAITDSKLEDPYEELLVAPSDCKTDREAFKAWLIWEWISPFGINLEKRYWDLRKRLGEPPENEHE